MFHDNVHETPKDFPQSFVLLATQSYYKSNHMEERMQQLEIFFRSPLSQKQQHDSVDVWFALTLR